MAGRIVEISGDGRSLHRERGFLAIRENGASIGRVPLDDIDTVIGAAHGLMWSNNALTALAERNVPVILLGQNFSPVAHVLPVAGNYEQGLRIQAQAEASKPLKKRLWAQIIKAKISAQIEVLTLLNLPTERLQRLKTEVLSGDSNNREALAAQYYWPQLLGGEFRRDRASEGANAMLNYGYAVLRAATARAILAAGLHPSLSLYHQSRGDGLRLADDMMEPFRPTIDITVFDLLKQGEVDVSQSVKQSLAATLQIDFITENGRTPLSHVLVRIAQSLVGVFRGSEQSLAMPKSMLPCLHELKLEEPSG